jgi:hypothetical protein
MSFREKRPGSLDTSDEAIARADARVRALPTKNTFIEFPVSVGQLEAVNSPAGGLRPYTTPAWMQTDLAASVRAAVSGDERDGSCPEDALPPASEALSAALRAAISNSCGSGVSDRIDVPLQQHCS